MIVRRNFILIPFYFVLIFYIFIFLVVEIENVEIWSGVSIHNVNMPIMKGTIDILLILSLVVLSLSPFKLMYDLFRKVKGVKIDILIYCISLLVFAVFIGCDKYFTWFCD